MTHPLRASLTALLIAGGLLTGGAAMAYEVTPVTGGGEISGTVRYTGAVPARTPLAITQDADYCGQTPIYDESLLVSPDQGLANVMVFIKDIQAGAAPALTQVTLNNTGCHYEPHVMVFGLGSELSVKNSDTVLHNTHAKLPRADVFNYALPRQGQVISSVMDRAGLMKVGCDAGHSWMSAYIAVFEHPYFALTDASGGYSIPDVPPGDYSLIFWHETLGAQTQAITVTSEGVQASAQFE